MHTLHNTHKNKSQVIRGLFFDLDGTIIDSEESHFRAYQKALEHHGRTFTHDDHRQVFGIESGTYLPMLYPDITADEVLSIKKLKAQHFNDFTHLIKPNHQLTQFLRTVRPRHITVLVTTGKRINIMSLLEEHGLLELFDHLVFGEDVARFKPHPEAYLKALKLSGLKADEVLAFEDSETGIQAASAAGLQVLKISIPST